MIVTVGWFRDMSPPYFWYQFNTFNWPFNLRINDYRYFYLNQILLSTTNVNWASTICHQTMKNRVLLENYYLPGDLERQIGTFVEYYNNQRYHESLGNVTPADVYFGRDKAIIREREKIKKLTIQNRRLQYQKQAA